MLTKFYVMMSVYLASLKNEEGQGMAEYGLILAVVALGAIAAFGLLADQLSTLIAGVNGKLVVP